MKYFETHAHYLAKRFNRDRDKLLLDMHKNGVEYIVNSTGTMELEKGLKLAAKYDFVYLSIGDNCAWTTPPEGDEYMSDEILARMIELCQNNEKIVAWGEIGIGLNRPEHTKGRGKENQIYWFKKQLEAAKQVGLPIVIHSRDACRLVFDILKEADMPDYGHGKGTIHCYTGTPKMAMEYAEMGYFISIGGIVTYRTAKDLAQTTKVVPLERILIETDCPYLAPEPNRGRRNDSNNLCYIVDKIAEIKGISSEEVAEATTANAKALFGIK